MDSCRENSCLRCLCEYFTTVVRVTGVIIAIVLWIIGLGAITSVPPAVGATVYLIFLAVVLSILEGLFLFESCITSCCRNDGCCGKTWVIVLYLDNWKRSILYIGLCIPCFVISPKPWTAYPAGVLIAILGVLYVIRTFYLRRLEPDESTDPAKSSPTGFTVASQAQLESQSRYPSSEPTRDEEMGKGGDAGLGGWEERYPS